MKLLLKMSDNALADQMDKKLEEASDKVHQKAAGMAMLVHKRLNPLEFEIEMSMKGGNFLFDRMIKKELKNTLKQIDPGASIEKL